MAKKSYHVVPNPKGGWSVKKATATRASKHFDKKSDAITQARDLSKKEGTELIIHGRDGTIKSKDSYGGNPNPRHNRDSHN